MSATSSTPPTAANVLRGALAELRRPLNADGNGWAQGQFGSGDRCKCAVGAINEVMDEDYSARADARAREALCDAIGAVVGTYGPGATIINWNDTPGRTFSEVEAAFERAIELAEADVR